MGLGQDVLFTTEKNIMMSRKANLENELLKLRSENKKLKSELQIMTEYRDSLLAIVKAMGVKA